MKRIVKIGDIRTYRKVVGETDLVNFQGEVLHRIYSTYALGRDMEWSSRLFFLEMKEDHEEGVGTFLKIEHRNPAFAGEELIFTAEAVSLVENELICRVEVTTESRLIATGQTGQKMLNKQKLEEIWNKARFSK